METLYANFESLEKTINFNNNFSVIRESQFTIPDLNLNDSIQPSKLILYSIVCYRLNKLRYDKLYAWRILMLNFKWAENKT